MQHRGVGKADSFGNAVEWQLCALNQVDGAAKPDFLHKSAGRKPCASADAAQERAR